MTYLVIGLGNPGSEYENTRHNAGFKAVDRLADSLGARYWKNACGARIAETKKGEHDIILVKPQSFMNLSGGPVKAAAAQYKVDPQHIIVVHDELDLEPGTVRIKNGGGHAGHNGLRSIHEKLGSPEYLRVRVGIGRPEGRRPVADYVLAQMKGDQLEAFGADCAQAADAVLEIIARGPILAMNSFNTKA